MKPPESLVMCFEPGSESRLLRLLVHPDFCNIGLIVRLSFVIRHLLGLALVANESNRHCEYSSQVLASTPRTRLWDLVGLT